MSGGKIVRRRPDAGDRLLVHAREVALTSDEWFLSAAQRFTRAGHWAKREAAIIGDSARAAWRTTLEVTLRVPKSVRASPEPAPTFEPGFKGIDVVSAMPLATLERDSNGDTDPEPARVSLLVRLLGQVVSEYAGRGYDGLANDARLWTLVGLLQGSRSRSRRAHAKGGRTR